jgi:hypothetical protein
MAETGQAKRKKKKQRPKVILTTDSKPVGMNTE